MVDYDPGLRPLVQLAIDDLVERLGIDDRSLVSVRSATLTTWSDRGFADSSGLRQAQVPVDGSEIVLEHDGESYRYRTGGHVYTPVLHS